MTLFSPPLSGLKPPFDRYAQPPGVFDEMIDANGQVRPPYQSVYDTFSQLPPDALAQRKQAADQALLQQGITFTVYGEDQGTERIFPYDLLPRVIPADDWRRIERGLDQRIRALNLFLGDLYHKASILKDGVVPTELVLSCKHYCRPMRGLRVPRDVYVSIAGMDLIRDGRASTPCSKTTCACLRACPT